MSSARSCRNRSISSEEPNQIPVGLSAIGVPPRIVCGSHLPLERGASPPSTSVAAMKQKTRPDRVRLENITSGLQVVTVWIEQPTLQGVTAKVAVPDRFRIVQVPDSLF